MTSDDDADERPSSSGTPFDAMDYHRMLVSAVLDTGVENASPLQIYERMTLPKDRNDPRFRNLQLGQIKSHLQRFRMVYKNGDARKESQLWNAEKKDFLDDYDSFVDFGLDAAAARNDESHSSVMGGRIIGLVSRLVMMEDGVQIKDFSKNPNIQESGSFGKTLVAERKDLDKSIPKLSPSEATTPLGQSIQLVTGMLEHLNNYITSERQKAEQVHGQLKRAYNIQDTPTRVLAIGGQPFLSNHLEKISLLPPLPSEGRPLRLPLLPPQQQLIHPGVAERMLMQQQQHQIRQQRIQQRLENLEQSYTSATGQIPNSSSHRPPPLQQQNGRERLNSFSDVSSIGGDNEQSLITEEDLHFALLLPYSKPEEHIYDQPQELAKNQRLGKFIPVKETDTSVNSEHTIKIQGRVYRPQIDQIQQAYWHNSNLSQNRSVQVPPSLGSFDVPSPAAPLKMVVQLAHQALSASTATAPTLPQNLMAASSQRPHVVSKMPSTRPHARKSSGESIKTKQHQSLQQLQQEQFQKSRRSKLRELSRLSRKLSKYSPVKLRQRCKHPTKKSMIQKLHKVISDMGVRKGRISSNTSQSNGGRTNPNKTSGTHSTTGKTAHDDMSSVVSSLSSSSASSLDTSGDSPDVFPGNTTTGVLGEQGALVSVTKTTSKNRSNESNTKDKNDWMFNSFSIPRNVRLIVRPDEQQDQGLGDGEDMEFDQGEEDDNSWCNTRSSSNDSDCKWGIVKVKTK